MDVNKKQSGIQKLMHVTELKVDQNRLVAACNALKDCKHQLAQLSFDCGNLDDLSSVFQAGWELLAFFPPNESTSELSMLEAQLESHKAFSMSRMAAHGWSYDSSCLATSLDHEAAISSLSGILEDLETSNTVAALSVLFAAVNILDDYAIRESVIDEAWRLQVRDSCCHAYQN